MPSRVRSYSKINLGLAIGPPRSDGFHSLCTLYQTVGLHDELMVTARPASTTRIQITSNDPRVPRDARNTAWKMVEKTFTRLGIAATVNIRIQKNLPIQGGMGAGSANAAATLLGLERELQLDLPQATRLELAAEVGSDVPLFLIGGSVLGEDRGQAVRAVQDVTLGGSTEIACVIALPDTGVSTPLAFREWDRLLMHRDPPDLRIPDICDTLSKLSRTFATVFPWEDMSSESGASGIVSESSSAAQASLNSPEKLHGLSSEQLHTPLQQGKSDFGDDLAENSLLALVRTGSGIELENDFETVVFPQYPPLREIKRELMGSATEHTALYAALSGSGSALFGLYRNQAGAIAAQQRLQQVGIRAIVTSTMPRPLYWNSMFAE